LIPVNARKAKMALGARRLERTALGAAVRKLREPSVGPLVAAALFDLFDVVFSNQRDLNQIHGRISVKLSTNILPKSQISTPRLLESKRHLKLRGDLRWDRLSIALPSPPQGVL
jgi:hypothetical protein